MVDRAVADRPRQLMALLAFYCALGQAFDIFIGMTGYVDFGYVTFMALGTYGMALGITNFYQSGLGIAIIFIGLLLGLFLAALSGISEALIALRLRAAYFAIACIGINEGVRYLIEGTKIWGGSEGIVFSRELKEAFGVEMANRLSTFWADVAVLIIAIIAAFITIHFMRGKIGYALTAIRQDEDAAKVMGINTTKYKTIAFVTSGLLEGAVGAMAWALKLTYVFPPDVFYIPYTVECIVIVMLGGDGTLLGPNRRAYLRALQVLARYHCSWIPVAYFRANYYRHYCGISRGDYGCVETKNQRHSFREVYPMREGYGIIETRKHNQEIRRSDSCK